MANLQSSQRGSSRLISQACPLQARGRHRLKETPRKLLFLAAAVLLAQIVFAQSAPQITAVDPASGKVNDTITVTGTTLGKTTVVAVFLSDDKTDYKANVVDQADDKIVIKVPEVKPGSYNISVQVGGSIFIKPVRFTVQE